VTKFSVGFRSHVKNSVLRQEDPLWNLESWRWDCSVVPKRR